MSSLKTRPTDASPVEFIHNVEHWQRRADAETLLTMFTQITGRKPVMWGESIIGFGEYRYTNTRGTYSWLMKRILFTLRNCVISPCQNMDAQTL